MTAGNLALNFAAIRASLAAGISVQELIGESYRRALAVAQDGIFTALVAPEKVMARAEALAMARQQRGDELPLLGLTFAVKDNIHVAGMATTSNCPALNLMPAESALCVERLEALGAVLIGKNTMDQFATGLNGTRSPEPLCRNAINPNYIPGGSSSGSAVAVARDIVSFSLGSDTGGSGRVPAACNGIVGLKPTLGLVSTRGLLYNSRYFDCVPVFAGSCSDAYEILEHIAGHDPQDPFSRVDADQIALKAGPVSDQILAVPRASQRDFFGDDKAANAFAAGLHILRDMGYQLKEIDFACFAEAGRTVFQSAMVAERLIEYGEVIAAHPEAIHPAVLAAIEPGASYSAVDAFKALYKLKALKREAEAALVGCAALVVPTVPTIFTIDTMLKDPMRLNAVMGTYTYFVNPLDLCAVSVPGPRRADGLPAGMCFVGGAAADGQVRALATAFEVRMTM